MSVLESMLQHPSWHGILVLLIVSCIYLLGIATYRLYLSPIAKFPGPKLAALTLWYQYYFDVVQKGQYTWEIERMHQKYGPIVRVNPWEVHIIDPDFWDVIYASHPRRRNKWAFPNKAFGQEVSLAVTLDHDTHRMRRAILNPFFSKRSISELEPTIRENVYTLCGRIREFQKSKEPLATRYAFAAMSMDAITEYSFAKSYNCLTHPEFERKWCDAIDGLTKGAHFLTHFPWLLPLMQSLPDWLVVKMNPLMANLIRFHNDLSDQITTIMNDDSKESLLSHPTIFHEILQSDVSPQEKSFERMRDEGLLLVGAGQITTADTLETAFYRLHANPETLNKLKIELEEAMPDPNKLPPLAKLEQLPYLSAVINEGLRLACPVVNRSPRICPDETLTFNGWTIPPNTVVSMTHYHMMVRNDKYFPEPGEFKPERWLVPPTQRHKLQRYLVPFGSGSRICLGQNLAMAELFLTLAAVIRQFDFELYDTKPEDVAIAHDYITPAPREGSKRCRVIVQG